MENVTVKSCLSHNRYENLTNVIASVFPNGNRPSMMVDVEDFLDACDVDGVIVASPAETHFALSFEALKRGKHVFVEKPLCLNSTDAEKLLSFAKSQNKILFVDNTYLYSDCVSYMKRMVENGSIGRPLFLHSIRTQMGIYRKHSVLWDLAPHDLSIIRFIFPDEDVKRINLTQNAYFQNNTCTVSDSACYSISFRSGFQASAEIAWCNPKWSRDVVIVGENGMLLFENNTTVKYFSRDPSYQGVPDRHHWQLIDTYEPNDNPLRNGLELFCQYSSNPDNNIPRYMRPEFSLDIISTIEELERTQM